MQVKFDVGWRSSCLVSGYGGFKRMTPPVYDGCIKDGFRKYKRSEAELPASGKQIIIRKYKRKHVFGLGYKDQGKPREITGYLNERDAKAVRDLIDDWLESIESEDGDNDD